MKINDTHDTQTTSGGGVREKLSTAVWLLALLPTILYALLSVEGIYSHSDRMTREREH